MKDIGLPEFQVSDEYLFEHLLPPLNQGFDIDRICNGLKRRCVLNGLRGGRFEWNGINKTTKNDSKNTAFLKRLLTDIISSLNSEVNRISSESIPSDREIEIARNQVRLSGNLTCGTALFLSDTIEKYTNERYWYNIAVPISFSKNNMISIHDDIEQSTYPMQYIMAYDPCRRFVYGTRMTNTAMQVWFLSRRAILVSDEFDINKDYRSVVKILLSLLYASSVELGWDATISTSYIDGERVCTIDISGNIIQVDELQAHSLQRARMVVGPGTRVYEAQYIVEGKKAGIVILKDYWLADKWISEPKIRDMILDDITDLDDRKYVDGRLLSYLACEQAEVNDIKDHAEGVTLLYELPDYSPLTPQRLSSVKRAARTNNGAQGKTHSIHKDAQSREGNQREGYSHHTHYRILYNEVAIPFYKLTNSKEIMTVLVAVIETLLRIHKAGWVHDDICAGNIYLYVDPVTNERRGMLGDLEFAKKVGAGATCDARIGTLDFMSNEIASGQYLFAKGKEEYGDKKGDALMKKSRATTAEPEQNSIGAKTNGGTGFCYNYIHDIESIWWVAIWTLFSFEKKAPSEDDELDHMSSSIRWRNKQTIFPGTLTSTARAHFLRFDETFEYFVEGCIPRYFSDFQLTLMVLRGSIETTYRKEELSKPIVIRFQTEESDEFEGLHTTCLSLLRDAKENMGDFDVVLAHYFSYEKTVYNCVIERRDYRFPVRARRAWP